MGFLDFFKKENSLNQEKISVKYAPRLEEKIENLSPQGRATVAFNARRSAEKMRFPGYDWNKIVRYIDGIVRGEDKEYVVKKCGLDLETAQSLDKLIEKEVDKVLY